MDLMTDVIAMLKTKSQLYGCLDLTGPFAFRFPEERGHFFIVTRGACFLEVEAGPVLALTTGDFVFLPSTLPFSIRSSPDRPARPFTPAEAEEFYRTKRLAPPGGDGLPVSLISGCFSFSEPESGLLIEHLPTALLMPRTEEFPWAQTLIPLIAHEVGHQGLGSKMAIDRLSEVLLIHTLRDYFDHSCQNHSPSWIGALQDAQMGAALQSIHADPGHPWTVEELASAVGMSRSAFAARFKTLVGATPVEHMTRWRMARAASLLQKPGSPKLETIAATVGYESESSFRKAFQRAMGVSPSQYRGQVAVTAP